ncbi:MAG: MBL fold metallo-hydrolase [Gammaproteobacteria bacterium]|nr:MBL fold metallo-hydrolase [Gammaproteobacteria bacterium]
MLNVGEGQALILKRENAAMLIDTGSAAHAAHVVTRLKAHNITSLDAVIVTHLHPDHASGYFRIRESYPETMILHNAHPLPDRVAPDMVRWVRDAIESDSLQQVIRQGDTIPLGDLSVEVLWPSKFVSHNLNAHSLVLRITVKNQRIVIMGDATKWSEQRLLQQGLLSGSADVLVVGHHGAADASSEALLKQLQPRLSLISVNSGNIRGYPAAETLHRLVKHSGQVLRTDIDGEVCISLVSSRLQRQPCR